MVILIAILFQHGRVLLSVHLSMALFTHTCARHFQSAVLCAILNADMATKVTEALLKCAVEMMDIGTKMNRQF